MFYLYTHFVYLYIWGHVNFSWMESDCKRKQSFGGACWQTCGLRLCVQGQRKGSSSVFCIHVKHHKGVACLQAVDYSEQHGYIKGAMPLIYFTLLLS